MNEISTGGGQADHRALYLRWRPRSFADVVGQEAVVRTLRNAVARGTAAHAYLLCGPRGTGKTSLARILYKALNCEDPRDGDPCGSCPSCLASDSGRAMDLIEIDAASNRGIDDMRSLRERARFAPTEARSKVYIVDEAHQLTQPAWDAFLKTLEEPPPSTVFVLATTAAHKIPATIVSRCQRFDLARIPQIRIAGHLEQVARSEGIDLESGVAERVARLARGGMRDALSMLEQLAAFGGASVTLEGARRVLGLVRGDALQSFIDALARRDPRRAFVLLEDIGQEGADLRQFLDEVQFYLRATLLTRVGADEAVASDFGPEEREWIRTVAQFWGPGEIAEVLRQYGEINAGGLDERQLLTRLELATAWVTRGPNVAQTEALAAPLAEAPRADRFEPPPTVEVPSPSTMIAPAGEPTVIPELAADQRLSSNESAADAVPTQSRSTRSIEQEARESPPPAPARTPAAGAARPPSLATLQAIWPLLLDRFQGPLLAKMLLSRVAPVVLVEGVVTFQGPLDHLELQRLDTQYRPSVELLLTQEVGFPVQARFRGGEAAGEDSAEESPSVAEFAAALFGGQIIPVGESD